jgi:pyruvate,orthophosphate dikinase
MSILAHENIQHNLHDNLIYNINLEKNEDNFIHFFYQNVEKKADYTKEKLGGKGLSVMEMSNLGIPVPEGFIIDTRICIEYNKTQKLPENFEKNIHQAILELEKITQKNLDGKTNLLMLSIRSGAPISMPGMMDTILNVGLTRKNLKIIAKDFGDLFAYNSYLRLLECYISTVLNLDYKNLYFNGLYLTECFNKFLRSDYRYQATNQEFESLIDFVSSLIEKNNFGDILFDVKKQIYYAILAVLNSYNSHRAKAYRELNGIPDNLGTAVIVQAMVFGNMNDQSCTGVLFSRDPSTGENKIFGEYIINAQGEDVVSGICTPSLINDIEDSKSMINLFPQCYKELDKITKKLETHHKDMQDIEFTVENNKLYILQSRSAKRSVDAEMKCAIDLVKENLISEKEALLMINPSSIDKMLHPVFQIDKNIKSITKGLPASPGAAVGKVIFDSEKAFERSKIEKVLLVRMDTSPEDIMGMTASQGILTARGGMTSHAAVVARGMGKPCVCGAMKIHIYENKSYCEILQSNGEKIIVKEGDTVSINGTTGDVYLGEIALKDSEFSENFNIIMSWADKYRRLKVRVNADTEQDCRTALKFGAEGIGLCRTEHMFFDEKRILYVRKMILSEKVSDRKSALEHIKAFQKEDFIKLFKIMDGLPVTIRLLDPPLHEFLPLTKETVEKFTQFSNFDINYVNEKVNLLSEKNPMLGHRGCRLGISYPEIYECQVEAIFEAIVYLKENHPNIKAYPEIMVPLIAWTKEAKILISMIHKIADFYQTKYNIKIDYLVGSMIELPRAALSAGEIAKDVDFFSFGTNDLTQTTLGVSRDDLIHFLNDYIENGIFDKNDDPFVTIDPYVGELIKTACEKGRATKENIKLGVCGEHGGSPKSIELFEKLGLAYVSSSPYRIPVARLAAAQAFLRNQSQNH